MIWRAEERMRRAILPADQPDGSDPADPGSYFVTDAVAAPRADAVASAAKPHRVSAAKTGEPLEAHDLRPVIQVIPPSECMNGQSLLLPTLTLPTLGDETGGNHARQAYDLDPPHETGVYLLAIARDGQHCRYWHARHYLGWAIDIADRVAAHRRGKGASFTQALVSQGYGLWLVAWFPGDRTEERAIKLTHHAPRFCPLCRAGLCLVDQSPRHALSQASSGAEQHGEAYHVADQITGKVVGADIPDGPQHGLFFRQDHLLALTDDSAGDTARSEDAARGETLVGDTLVEPFPPNDV